VETIGDNFYMGSLSASYEPSGSQVRPWSRWAARNLDFLLFSFLVGLVIGIFEMLTHQSTSNIPDSAFNILFGFVYATVVEPIMLCSWGTTPGKALLKIRLRQQNGAKLSYELALERSFAVWIKGLGIGLPFISLFTLLNSYNVLTKEGKTPWDRDGDFSVSHQVIGPLRVTVIVLLLLSFLVLVVAGKIATK
jgi:uncharacterized RDD family membrane protein YckC